MPMYDYACPACGAQAIDVWEPVVPSDIHECLNCKAIMVRSWFTHPPAVAGDECDITIKHGLCDEKTGEPVRYRSKSEIAREARRRGLINFVEHKGTPGGDRSKHTTRWV